MKKEVTHFKCEGCSKYKVLKDSPIINAEVATNDRESHNKYICYHVHVRLCKECYDESFEDNTKKDKQKKKSRSLQTRKKRNTTTNKVP